MLTSTAGTSRAHPGVRAALPFFVASAVVGLLAIAPAWPGTPAARSATVSYADLDLSSAAGAKTLYQRIQAAARQVCGHPGADALEQGIWKSCYRNAVGDAVAKVNSPQLTALHTGNPAAMTAMLAK